MNQSGIPVPDRSATSLGLWEGGLGRSCNITPEMLACDRKRYVLKKLLSVRICKRNIGI